MRSNLRKRIFYILEKAKPGNKASIAFDVFVIALIILNVFAILLESVQYFSINYQAYFRGIETFSVYVFTAEYLLRIWSCVAEKKYSHPIKGRIKFALTPLVIIDLLAILPFYFQPIAPMHIDLRFGRIIRLYRLFMIFKLTRYSRSVKTLIWVLKDKKEELAVAVFFMLTALVICSSVMYFIEHNAQPNVFSSIPASMWWGVITLTTVGYGDVTPITIPGKIVGGIISILGVGMYALPTGILGSGFVNEMQKHKKIKLHCPHCKEEVDPTDLYG